MTFPFPYGGITVTVVRPVYDRFNDATWTDIHDIAGCQEYPATTSESSSNVGIRDVRTLLVPGGSDVKATDRIVLWEDGATAKPTGELRKRMTYNVIGRPKDWTHAMTGWNPGMSVELERVS